jgi:uncharacterized protein (DUF1697 family)
MTRAHVALLRGINVGRAKRVAMADLRGLVARLGYSDVRTLLNSGNIVFSVPRAVRGNHAARIEQAIATRLHVSTRVIVLTAAELEVVVEANPLGPVADDPSRLLVHVLANSADRARLVPLTREDWAPEALALGARVAYLWCANGILKSNLAVSLNRVIGEAATSRNWATITKLHALASSYR